LGDPRRQKKFEVFLSIAPLVPKSYGGFNAIYQ
jgi:hypothetical protein